MKECRNHFWGDMYNDHFIILNYNVTQLRKRIDITIDAYRQVFEKNYSNKTLLILKSETPELRACIEKYNDKDFSDSIVFINKKLPISDLNILYNAVDIGINTSVGEGWGLVSCEHALTGKPQILPDNTCSSEIYELSPLIQTKEECYKSANSYTKIYESSCICQLCQLIYNPVLKTGTNVTETTTIDILSEDSDLILNILVNPIDVAYVMSIKHVCVKDMNEICEVIARSKYYVVQIFFVTGENQQYLKYYDPNFFRKECFEYYKVKCYPKFCLDSFELKNHVPLVDSCSELLDRYYKDLSLRHSIGDYQSELIKKKYTKAIIQQKFLTYLDEIIDSSLEKIKEQ